MGIPCASSLKVFPFSSFSCCFPPKADHDSSTFSSSPSPYVPKTHSEKPSKLIKNSFNSSFRLSYRFSAVEDDYDDDDTSDNCSFDEAIMLFNDREYYKCHDSLEALWNMAQEPTRTLIHGILQCAVGFHHLFNQVGTSFVGLALLIHWFILFTFFFLFFFQNFGYWVLMVCGHLEP